jgi:hypothetical protein
VDTGFQHLTHRYRHESISKVRSGTNIKADWTFGPSPAPWGCRA